MTPIVTALKVAWMMAAAAKANADPSTPVAKATSAQDDTYMGTA
jgi:hypothetical protein